MSWTSLTRIYKKIEKSTTIPGKLWILGAIGGRYMGQSYIGGHSYSDEQKEFVCNTREPGCRNVCFNEIQVLQIDIY